MEAEAKEFLRYNEVSDARVRCGRETIRISKLMVDFVKEQILKIKENEKGL